MLLDEAEVGPFYIPANAATTSYRPRVLKQGDTFLVLDPFGDAQATGPAAEGLFHRDTRYLSQLTLTIEGQRPLLLSSSVTAENATIAVDMTNPDLTDGERITLPRDTVHVLRTKVLDHGALYERLALRNFGVAPARIQIELGYGADFADIFEVRGMVRAARGLQRRDERVGNTVTLAYEGLDHVLRSTRIVVEPSPDSWMLRRARWDWTLAPGEARTIDIDILCETDRARVRRRNYDDVLAETKQRITAQDRAHVRLISSNELFNDWVGRSRADLDMLITETSHGRYPYAGIPWFSCPFGRDGIITALETLWLDPDLAAGTLRYLAATQAQVLDPGKDAEPGKILHETRGGEMSDLGEVPFGRYYGSVDSTPLFIVLAGAYEQRTGDLNLIRELWPSIEAALGWMDRYGDIDGDQFLEYDRKSVNGLINQGWKDSADSIFHADGRLADAPIALAEVQAYAFAAWREAARLAKLLGAHEQASVLAARAENLRVAFEDKFWDEELGLYVLALDGEKRACRVRSSNAGHALFGGIAASDRADRVAHALLGPAFFSHWGIRTIATDASRYNPMSYHNGSIWPHDNGLIAMGLARYGKGRELTRLLSGMFDSAMQMDLNRLPELFCGFDRRTGAGPTAYPVACIPQAWAAASVFAILGAMLGVEFDPAARQIRFTRPALPPWMDELRIENLRLGNGGADILLRRHGESVSLTSLSRSDDVQIVMTA
ncbi:amylo-alpha-1,6-glucosidase [Rhodospirillales bacterium TMPK1]|uniref:Amylo-alpha-1,6-glucosidase n=2 Tax=Roseiterribacter gracilis TaxID=2812848 RepID=A0A8S8XKV1_9PROT|nr:amylo-alpha-1,6-glucosidase [Rhodospirillales bacterium TMPK1]